VNGVDDIVRFGQRREVIGMRVEIVPPRGWLDRP
jgi:hypothetical protein